jgi:hypothetical protein
MGLKSVPAEVNDLYQESRESIATGAFTASVLCSRKLLMNIAVSKGANPSLHFIEYVKFLAVSSSYSHHVICKTVGAFANCPRRHPAPRNIVE